MKCMFPLTLVLALALAPGQARAQEQVLRIGNYGGTFTQTTDRCVADLFKLRTGAKVEWVDGNPTDQVSKLIVSKGAEPPFDLVYLDDSARAQAVAADVVSSIPADKISNLDKIYDVAKKNMPNSVVVNFFSVGLAYNTKILKEKGIPEPTKWSDLWNPKLAGHIALPDITTSAGMATVIVASWMTGQDEHDVKDAFKKLAEIEPLYFFKSSSDLQAKFQSGDAWIAPWYNGRAWGMINKGFPMKFIYPENKGFGMTTTLHIAKGTKNADLAAKYIDVALDPLAQLCQAYYLPYGPTNNTLAGVMAAYPKLSQQFPSSKAELDELYLADFDEINTSFPKWLDQWNRVVVK